MTLRNEDIELQRHSDDCTAVAVVNFFKLRELPTPSVADVWHAFTLYREVSKGAPAPAPTCVEVLNVLAGGCNFLCALGVIPLALWHEPGIILRHYLDIGCHLFVFYQWRNPTTGEPMAHIVVAEGYDERGMSVIDGSAEVGGDVIVLEPLALAADELAELTRQSQARGHGARKVLPFYPCMTSENPIGLTPHFVVVYPGRFTTEEAEALIDGLTFEAYMCEARKAFEGSLKK